VFYNSAVPCIRLWRNFFRNGQTEKEGRDKEQEKETGLKDDVPNPELEKPVASIIHEWK